jgi:DnaJ-class molecular chaperone
MRAIQKTIEAVRGIDRWGASDMVERAFAAFEALPPPSEPDAWWAVLNVARSASAAEIEAAFKREAKRHHPDHGGDPAMMQKINRARQEGLATRH